MVLHAIIEDRVKDGTMIYVETRERMWEYLRSPSLLEAITTLTKLGYRIVGSCGGDMVHRIFFNMEISE